MADQPAHIVFPSKKLLDVLSGNKTKAKALCGAWVTKVPNADAHVCRDCFEGYVELDPQDAQVAAGNG